MHPCVPRCAGVGLGIGTGTWMFVCISYVLCALACVPCAGCSMSTCTGVCVCVCWVMCAPACGSAPAQPRSCTRVCSQLVVVPAHEWAQEDRRGEKMSINDQKKEQQKARQN